MALLAKLFSLNNLYITHQDVLLVPKIVQLDISCYSQLYLLLAFDDSQQNFDLYNVFPKVPLSSRVLGFCNPHTISWNYE